jgi:hypothetical protein
MSDPVPTAAAVPAEHEHKTSSLNEKGVAFEDTKEGHKDGDLEAGSPRGYYETGSDSEEIIVAREIQQRMGFLRSLRQGEEWLDAKIGIETQGIDRIHEEDKKPPSRINV